LFQVNGIREIGAASLLPGGPVGKARYQLEGNSKIGSMAMLWVDYDFIRVLGLKVLAGRDFSRDFPSDPVKGIIVNETAIRQLGFQKPDSAIGKSFNLIGGKRGTIIGLVNDFHFVRLQNNIEPLFLQLWPWFNYLLVRV